MGNLATKTGLIFFFKQTFYFFGFNLNKIIYVQTMYNLCTNYVQRKKYICGMYMNWWFLQIFPIF